MPHTSLLLQNSYFNILRIQTYNFFPKIYTVICVSLITLSKILNKLFLRKQASKLRQLKTSPSVTDSMVSISQMVSLHQTISPFRAAASSHATQLPWSFFYIILLFSALLVMPAFMPLLLPSHRPLLMKPFMHGKGFISICL